SIPFTPHTLPSVTLPLPLHDALPIWDCKDRRHERILGPRQEYNFDTSSLDPFKEIVIRGRSASGFRYEDIISYDRAKKLVEEGRSEEHTSELQSRENLVCRLLLEKKK